jgi:hypothetical protein
MSGGCTLRLKNEVRFCDSPGCASDKTSAVNFFGPMDSSWHFLNFFPEPHGHGSLRLTLLYIDPPKKMSMEHKIKKRYAQVNSKIGILAKMAPRIFHQALAGAEAAPIEAIGAMQADEKAGMPAKPKTDL